VRPFAGQAAIFDVDDSLVAGNVGTLFTRFLYSAGELDPGMRHELPRAILDYARGRTAERAMVELGTRCQRGIRADRLRLLARSCFERLVAPRITAAGRARLGRHLAAGHLVIVASGSPEPIVDEVARDVRAHVAVASQGVFREGVHTGEVFDAVCFEADKRRRVLATLAAYGLDPADAWLYSDSAADVPLFEAVGRPVVVDPKAPFAREALRRGWEVRRWRRPGEARQPEGPDASWAAWDR
jgi:HAD superfamily hydrolase (TIGR01490 family)